MGSFNAVCGVSRAPIRPNDEVVLLFLVSQSGIKATPMTDNLVKNSLSHRGLGGDVYDHFQVLGYPMHTKYDDYGTYALDESDPAVKYNIDFIKKYHVPVLSVDYPGEKYFDHFDISSEDLDEESINNLISEGCLYVKEYGMTSFIQYFPILKDVYDVIMKTKVNFYDRVGFNSYNLGQFKAYSNKQREADEKDYQETLNALVEGYQDRIGTLNAAGSIQTAEVLYDMACINASLACDSSYRADTMWSYSNSISHKKEPKPSCYDEAVFLVKVLNNLNIEMVPTMTAGQESCRHEHAAVQSKIGEVLMQRQLNEDAEGTQPAKCTESVIVVNLSDLEEFFNEHWNERIIVPGKEALENFKKTYSSTVTLTYEDAKKSNMDALFLYCYTELLSLQIVV